MKEGRMNLIGQP